MKQDKKIIKLFCALITLSALLGCNKLNELINGGNGNGGSSSSSAGGSSNPSNTPPADPTNPPPDNNTSLPKPIAVDDLGRQIRVSFFSYAKTEPPKNATLNGPNAPRSDVQFDSQTGCATVCEKVPQNTTALYATPPEGICAKEGGIVIVSAQADCGFGTTSINIPEKVQGDMLALGALPVTLTGCK